jgi:hypothetical protein
MSVLLVDHTPILKKKPTNLGMVTTVIPAMVGMIVVIVDCGIAHAIGYLQLQSIFCDLNPLNPTTLEKKLWVRSTWISSSAKGASLVGVATVWS